MKCSENKILQFRFNTGHEHSTNAGLGKQSRHTMISLMELQLGKNRGIPLFWQVFLILELHNLGTHLFGMSRKILTSSQF